MVFLDKSVVHDVAAISQYTATDNRTAYSFVIVKHICVSARFLFIHWLIVCKCMVVRNMHSFCTTKAIRANFQTYFESVFQITQIFTNCTMYEQTEKLWMYIDLPNRRKGQEMRIRVQLTVNVNEQIKWTKKSMKNVVHTKSIFHCIYKHWKPKKILHKNNIALKTERLWTIIDTNVQF